ncbi:MAG: hypothetical protein KBD21_04155, partial [Candidatus Pacebacteria bacterium]|nr:hypothetical protein [Candidatus Paceibacterota bacterium]
VVVVFVITIASLFFVSLKLHSCDLLFVGRDRYGCLGIKAGHTKDITLCEDPEVVARDVENDCYRAASSKWGNIDLCRRMNIKDVNLLLSRQGKCVRNVAVLTHDIEVCNEFPEDLVGGSDGRNNPIYERQSCKRDVQVVIDKGYSSYSQYLSGEN